MFKLQMQSKGLEFKVTYSDDFPDVVESDERRIKQVIVNLVSNALKFTSRGSVCLHASFKKETKELVFKITDTGIGIKKSDQIKLFQIFGKLRSSSK